MTDEELIDGLSFVAYQRVATTLQIPAIGVEGGKSQYLSVSPDELEAARLKDIDDTAPSP